MSSSRKIIKAAEVNLTTHKRGENPGQFRPFSLWGDESAKDDATPSRDRETEERLIGEAYERGRRAGIKEAENRSAHREESALKALDAIQRECMEIKNRLFDGMEHTVIVLAFALAEKIIRREATLDRKIIAANLREILNDLKDKAELSISLNPEDERYIREQLLDALDVDVPIRLAADPSLQPGDALVETSGLLIDARIIEQLDVLKSSITGGEGGNKT